MGGVASSPFHSTELYPELDLITPHFGEIRAEALRVRSSMTDVVDGRIRPGAWNVLPLLAEADDRDVVPDDLCMQNRLLVPRTIEILSTCPAFGGYALSALQSGGHIRPHTHHRPFVTAALCLQDSEGSHIVVGGERRDYREGEMMVFDYCYEHEVINNGPRERIVLLMLLPNRMKSRP
jgi:aspartyl/asparaginyl beta-hydroxylase (cupin superfamily)